MQNLDEDELIKPIWVDKKPKGISPYRLFVATPCHSEVSLHYVQSLLDISRMCHSNRIHVEFCILKSSLVTQGRNLCVSGFLESDCTHMLFIDSDINVKAKTVTKMLQAERELISVPYPLKAFVWDKGLDEIEQGNVKKPEDLEQIFNSYPMKVIDKDDIKYDITWKHSGEPFLTTERKFMNVCKESIKEVTELKTVVSTNGGTSDGRFMAKVCDQIIELGLTNRSIHKINESVKEDDLEVLKNIYKNILSKVFSS